MLNARHFERLLFVSFVLLWRICCCSCTEVPGVLKTFCTLQHKPQSFYVCVSCQALTQAFLDLSINRYPQPISESLPLIVLYLPCRCCVRQVGLHVNGLGVCNAHIDRHLQFRFQLFPPHKAKNSTARRQETDLCLRERVRMRTNMQHDVAKDAYHT